MPNEIREPKQERSIEKKNKIISASFELFSEVGYYNTNTAQIAKRAGVSTGIVYGYFKDKRDILLDVLELYVDRVYAPTLTLIDNLCAPLDLHSLVPQVLDTAIESHRNNAKIHEALHSMTHTDEAVSAKFIALEDEITMRIANKFSSLDVCICNLIEKVHFTMDIVQSFSHEYIYDNHSYIDYAKMRSLVETAIIHIFR